jgi:4-amino-4-deoxy-L-arabinose transferase-like glycosyltransferase
MEVSMKHWKTPNVWRWLLVAAIVSFTPSLFFQYVGEEGVYTITTLEMWHGHSWSNPVLYGTAYGRPPFLNWIMLPFTMLLGPAHVLVASRLVTALSTVGTAAALYAFARGIGATRRHAWLALLVFLSSDALLYHGWIAYSDPFFALLTFGAMACVTVAAQRKVVAPLGLGVVLVTAAFLTKALTAYVFVVAAWVVVFARHREARSTLLNPAALLWYLVGIAAPIAWFHLNSSADAGREGGAMAGDIVRRMLPSDPLDWFKHLVAFPVETFCRFLPVSAIVVYGLLRGRSSGVSETRSWDTTVALVAALNFIPYWLSPQGSMRYVMPLYPFIAFCLASKLATMTESTVRTAVYCVAAIVVLKFVGLVAFPIVQMHRGNAAAVAKSIVSITGSERIYTDDSTSAGLSVAANIDSQRWPVTPLTSIPPRLLDGWIFTRTASRPGTSVAWTGTLGKERMYLLCSGLECATAAGRLNRLASAPAGLKSEFPMQLNKSH